MANKKVQLKDDSGNSLFPVSSLEQRGGSVAGNVSVTGKITQTETPENNGDVATKGYVDEHHDSTKQDAITSTNKLSTSLIDGLANVATSGSYNDLTDTPTIPSGDALVSASDRENWDGKEDADDTILKQANVIDSTSSTSTVYPLSANQGKVLNERINAVESRGRFLSTWNGNTGKPGDLPGDIATTAYQYKTGDYFIVNVAGNKNPSVPANNTIPAGTTISNWSYFVTGSDVEINDTIYFTGSAWSILHSPATQTVWGGIGGTLSDQTDLQEALDDKVELTDLLDTNVKLSTTIYTDKTIGHITGTSSSAALVGNAGDTLKQVFTRMFGTITEQQPEITSNPSISSLSFSSSKSNEYGTTITTVNYSLSTNSGSYTYGPATGVTFSKYNFSGGTSTTGDQTSTTGTLTLSSTYTVGVSNPVSITCTGTHSAGVVAKTNLGNNSNPEVKIAAGTKEETVSFSKSAVYYPYYKLSVSTTVPTTSLNRSTNADCYTSGISIGSTSNYVYFYVPTGVTHTQIQYLDGSSWNNTGTEPLGPETITLQSTATATYNVYRTATPVSDLTLRII